MGDMGVWVVREVWRIEMGYEDMDMAVGQSVEGVVGAFRPVDSGTRCIEGGCELSDSMNGVLVLVVISCILDFSCRHAASALNGAREELNEVIE